MGYESTVELSVEIDKRFVEEYRKKAEEIIAKEITDDDNNIIDRWDLQDLHNQLEQIRVDDDGNLELDNYNGKWGDFRKFAEFILPFVTESGIIELTGEDGEKWGYEYDGKGKVYELEYISRRCEKPMAVLSEKERVVRGI